VHLLNGKNIKDTRGYQNGTSVLFTLFMRKLYLTFIKVYFKSHRLGSDIARFTNHINKMHYQVQGDDFLSGYK
jgi:hypothetical protein